MRMMMRPVQTQFADRFKYIGVAYSFSRDLYMHAGYTHVGVALVGGAGGRGGDSVKNADNSVWGAGGGGGGSLILNIDLKDLPVPGTLASAGVAGTHGANVASGVLGVAGTAGGDSTFMSWTAFGGKGGGGGKVDYDVHLGGSGNLSDGGDGGDNSLGLGTVGQGSTGTNISTTPNHTVPTAGVAEAGGQIGGGGGGGGTGKARTNAQTNFAGEAGKAGNVGWTLDHAGGPMVASKGGDGGGADIQVISGAHEYYGSYAAGANPNGVVAFLLS